MKLPPEELVAASVSAKAQTPSPRLPRKYSLRKLRFCSRRLESPAIRKTPIM